MQLILYVLLAAQHCMPSSQACTLLVRFRLGFTSSYLLSGNRCIETTSCQKMQFVHVLLQNGSTSITAWPETSDAMAIHGHPPLLRVLPQFSLSPQFKGFQSRRDRRLH
jgi:hypothetical protein